MEYRWDEIQLQVQWETHDPGVINRDSVSTTVRRSDLREGKQIRHEEPGTSLHAVTLVAMDKEGVVLSVAGRQFRMEAGEHAELDHSGESYTEFRLYAHLPLSLAALTDTTGIRYPFQIFRMERARVDALRLSDKSEAKYLLGMWHYLQNLDEEAYGEAAKLLREAAEGGIADAWMGLANMYYNGTAGKLDMDEYVRLRDKGVEAGSEWAKTMQLDDLFFGIHCEADRERALKETEAFIRKKAPKTARFLEEEATSYKWHQDAMIAFAKLEDLKSVDARIYIALGDMLYMMDETDHSTAAYRMAVAADYVDAYRRLDITGDTLRMGRKAESSYVICHEGDVELQLLERDGPYAKILTKNKKDFYYYEAEKKLNNGKYWLEEALRLGEKRAALLLGNLYRDGTIISGKELDKAWHYYHRGFQMRDYECARMCALMIDCGEKKDAPHRMDYYLGWAERFQ